MYNDFPPHIRFSSLRQVFIPNAFHVGFLAVRLATEQVVLLLLGFLPSSVIPPPIRIHSLPSGDGTTGPQVPSGDGTTGPQVPSGDGTTGPQVPSGDGTPGPQVPSGDGTTGPQVPSGDGTTGPQVSSGDGTTGPQVAAALRDSFSSLSPRHHRQDK